MSNVSYSEYLKYIKIEFSKIDPATLSQEEKEYYDVVKRDLENSKNMPSRILKSSILSSDKQLSAETVENLEYIKGKVGVQGQINKFKESVVTNITNFFSKSKNNSRVFTFNFAVIVISFVVFYILTTTVPISTTINTPYFDWHTTTVVRTVEPDFTLVGAAGLEPSDEVTEKYVLAVTWRKGTLDITYIIWSIIPLLALASIIYVPSIKWAWAK